MRRKYVPDLVKLGAHHEANYRRMMKLLRLMTGKESARFALHSGAQFVGQVEITLLEACKYTDTLLLQQTSSAGKWLNNPSMTVRIYHDAAVAEVISCHGHRRVAAVNDYPNKYMHHPDEKSQLNAFLSEWLNFCLLHGCCDARPFGEMKM